MSGRDERLAGRLPMWVWETLGEQPPHPPGAEPVRRKLTEEEKAETWRSMAAHHARENPDAPPLDPETFTVNEWATTHSPALADALHSVDGKGVRDRLGRWEDQTKGRSVEAVAAFWTEKADAVERLEASGYLTSKWGTGEIEGFAGELRARAVEAQRAVDLIRRDESSETGGKPAWLRLAEPSRANDKWGPLVPFLDYAFQTTLDASQAGVLKRLAEVCRDDEMAAAYCAERGIDLGVSVPIPPQTLSKLKVRALEHRRRQRPSL